MFISISNAQQPTVMAQPGLSAAVGNVLAWRRCVMSSGTAGIGRMSLLENVVSPEGSYLHLCGYYNIYIFTEDICRLRILITVHPFRLIW